MSMLLEAKNKVEGLLSHLDANLGRRLPFKGLLIRRLGEFLGGNLQLVADAIDKAQLDGSATKAIDDLVDLLRDAVPTPALLRPLVAPFARMFFERVRQELHKNQDLILDKVGSLIPAVASAALRDDSIHKTAGQLAREARKLKGF